MAELNICVCVKRVPAPGARINVTDDGQSVDTANLGFTTSPHEECAVEAAVQLVEEHGGNVTVLTLGPPQAEEQLRYAASVGTQRCVLVPTDGDDWDPERTAAALTSAISNLEAADGPFDLVLFGNESADSSGYQVGIRTAHALDRPMVNGLKGIEIEGETVTVRREIDGGFERYEFPMPAMLGVKEGINLPRYPTMKGRLGAKKAVIEEIDADGAKGGLTKAGLRRPAEQVSNTQVIGSKDDIEAAAEAIVDLLVELELT